MDPQEPKQPQTDETPIIPTKNTETAPQPPAEDQFKTQDPPIKVKKSKKKFLLVLLILLLLAAAGGAYYWFFMKKTTEPVQNTDNAAKPAEKQKDLYFYIAESNQPKEYTLYNVKTKEKITKKLDLEKPLITTSIDANSPFQITPDNTIIGYASGTIEDLIGGNSPGPQESSITLLSGGATTKIVTYKDSEKVYDWVFSNDKSTVYYTVLTTKDAGQKLSLYKYVIATKDNVLIKDDIVSSSSIRTRLYAVGDNDVRMYSTLQFKIKEHAYTGGAYAEKNIASTQCIKVQCQLSFPQALSPDGKSLLSNGSDANSFALDQLTLSDGSFKQLDKAGKTTESLRAVVWSPDNKKVAVDTAPFGLAGQQQVGFEVRLDLVDIATGTITKVAKDNTPGLADADKYNDHFIELLKWSLDNNYVAFVNNNVVKLYSVTDQTTIDTGIAQQNPVNSGTSYGWIYQ